MWVEFMFVSRIFHWQVQRIRVKMLRSHRSQHAQRIKQDQDTPSGKLSLELRMAWAAGSWIQPMIEVHGFFFDVGLLQSLDIVTVGRTDDPADRAVVTADEFLLTTFEAFARVYWGLQTRSYIIWSGGVYNTSLFCSDDEHLRLHAIDRAQRLQPRVQALDELLNAEAELQNSCDRPGVVDFGHKFFWRHGIVYRELLMLSAYQRHDEAMWYSWSVHAGVSHEKGVEGLFRNYRRLTRRGTENGTISIEHLHNAGALAGKSEFRNVLQAAVMADDLEASFGRGRWDEVRREVPRLSQDRRSLPMLAYRCPEASPLRKPCDADPSCVASAHAEQIGCEHCLLACPLADDGRISDFTLLERSWLCQLVHTVSSVAKNCEVPTVLVHQKSDTAWLIVLELGRSLLAWPLRVLCSKKMEMGLCGLTNLQPLIVTDACPANIAFKQTLNFQALNFLNLNFLSFGQL